MRILALDLGERRTGCAYANTKDVGFPMPLPTLMHVSEDEREAHVQRLIQERAVDEIVLGLPLLSGGKEGEQAEKARAFGTKISKTGVVVHFVDERYTSRVESPLRNPKKWGGIRDLDPNSMAAMALLEAFLQKLTI